MASGFARHDRARLSRLLAGACASARPEDAAFALSPSLDTPESAAAGAAGRPTPPGRPALPRGGTSAPAAARLRSPR